MLRQTIYFATLLTFGITLSACKDDGGSGARGVDLTDIAYAPVPYALEIPRGFPEMAIPEDNPITEAGVQLGRRLFYDPILSADGTQSCSSCHQREKGFADGQPVSRGIDGVEGTRSAMSLLNAGYFENGLNWDGDAPDLETQAMEPVVNPIELHEDWGHVEEKLRAHPDYPKRFREAFGISHTGEITQDLVTKALAQFERIMVSGGHSRYDVVLRGESFFTDSEAIGYDIFFDVSPDFPDAECGHCHNGFLLSSNSYFNNGITAAPNLTDFPDLGRGGVTRYEFDNGKFRAPSLRNIALTAPYMHDGRFLTLEEVIDHYDSGGHYADNLDPLIEPINLTEEQKQDLLDFLHTFTDTTFLEREVLTNPF